MDSIRLDVPPAEGHSSEHTSDTAAAMYQAVRVLNDAGLAENAPEAMPDLITLYDVVRNLQESAAGMDQLIRRLAERLGDIATHQQIIVSSGVFQDAPAAAVDDALQTLETARNAACGLEIPLRYAANALASLDTLQAPDRHRTDT